MFTDSQFRMKNSEGYCDNPTPKRKQSRKEAFEENSLKNGIGMLKYSSSKQMASARHWHVRGKIQVPGQ